MKATVEELIRLEEQDIRELKREDLDNAEDIVIDRSLPAKRRMKAKERTDLVMKALDTWYAGKEAAYV